MPHFTAWQPAQQKLKANGAYKIRALQLPACAPGEPVSALFLPNYAKANTTDLWRQTALPIVESLFR